MSPATQRTRGRDFVSPPSATTGIPLDVDWRVLLPMLADTPNLVSNPSFETNTTGWNANVGSVLTRTTAKQRRGAYSMKVSPTASGDDGAWFNGLPLVAGQRYYTAFDFWGNGGEKYKAFYTDVSFHTFLPAFKFIGKGYWDRIGFFRNEILTTTRYLYVVKDTTASIQPYYIDGVSVVASNYPVSYWDGDSTGYVPGRSDFYWTGTPHGSASVMIGQSRAAGRIVSLSTYGFMVLAMLGLGMGPVNNVSIPLALVGGEQYQRTVKGARTFDLVGTLSHSSPIRFQNNIASLIAAFAPDAVSDQPAVLQYQPLDACGQPNGETLEIPCKYAGGLEGKRDNPYQEDLDVKFSIYMPYVTKLDGSEGATLATQATLAANALIWRNTLGVWSSPGALTGVLPTVTAIRKLPNGTFAVGGTFASIGGIANSRGIAIWNPYTQTWTALGSGAGSGSVTSLVVDAAGNLYAGGSFTSMGGVANTKYIAKWNGSVWSALGTGGSGGSQVYALNVDIYGQVWAGGDFTTMGGVAAPFLAVWDGSTWNLPSTLGGQPNSTVIAITNIPGSQDLVVGGSFTQIGGITVSGIALIPNASATPVNSLAGGVTSGTDTVNALFYGPNGLLYAGGLFSKMGGAANTNLVAVWNGNAWTGLGVGITTGVGVQGFALDPVTNDIYVYGNFTVVGGLTLPGFGGLAIWRNTYWMYPEIVSGLTGGMACVFIPGDGSQYVSAQSNSITWTIAATTTVTNTGSASAYPVIQISHPTSATQLASIYPIRNATTGEQFSLALALQPGETLTIDLQPGRKTITSNFRGNLFSTLLPGSSFSTWHLQPGPNTLSILTAVASGNLPTVTIYWTPTYNAIESAIR